MNDTIKNIIEIFKGCKCNIILIMDNPEEWERYFGSAFVTEDGYPVFQSKESTLTFWWSRKSKERIIKDAISEDTLLTLAVEALEEILETLQTADAMEAQVSLKGMIEIAQQCLEKLKEEKL